MHETLTAVRPLLERPLSTHDSALFERVLVMRSSALFAGLTQSECARIAECASTRSFAPDEFLFMQGEPGHNLILIQTGSVKLTQISPAGSEVILWMTGGGEPVGLCIDPAHGGNPCYSCSARAMENCSALAWDYSRVRFVLEQYPRIRINMNSILAVRLEELQERFREIATERVAKRLALALIRLSKQVGRPHHAGVQVLLSREELAQMIGTTLFTISRILSKWSDEGIVLARREAVVLCNVKDLQGQAELEE